MPIHKTKLGVYKWGSKGDICSIRAGVAKQVQLMG